MDLIDMIFVGDIVYYGSDTKTLYKITSTRGSVNYKAEGPKGPGYTLPIRGTHKASNPEDYKGPVVPVAPVPEIELGMAIRFRGRAATEFPGIFVLIRKNGTDRGSFAKLGGDNGRYVTGSLRNVDLVDEINNYGK